MPYSEATNAHFPLKQKQPSMSGQKFAEAYAGVQRREQTSSGSAVSERNMHTECQLGFTFW